MNKTFRNNCEECKTKNKDCECYLEYVQVKDDALICKCLR